MHALLRHIWQQVAKVLVPGSQQRVPTIPLFQVERYSHMPDPKLGWQPGDAWGHRRNGYRRMAEMLGGVPLQAWKDTYAREPDSTKHIVNDVTPEVKHYVTPVVAF